MKVGVGRHGFVTGSLGTAVVVALSQGMFFEAAYLSLSFAIMFASGIRYFLGKDG